MAPTWRLITGQTATAGLLEGKPLSQGRPRSGGVWMLVSGGPRSAMADRGSASANAPAPTRIT
ncbi:hypothetical protein FJP65_16890 [Stenotrophomonas maltophilia]|nr:hypothetical protein FJP65_16890 [Stenotrophomonas maltophilia]